MTSETDGADLIADHRRSLRCIRRKRGRGDVLRGGHAGSAARRRWPCSWDGGTLAMVYFAVPHPSGQTAAAET